jgi:hypothetical protein
LHAKQAFAGAVDQSDQFQPFHMCWMQMCWARIVVAVGSFVALLTNVAAEVHSIYTAMVLAECKWVDSNFARLSDTPALARLLGIVVPCSTWSTNMPNEPTYNWVCDPTISAYWLIFTTATMTLQPSFLLQQQEGATTAAVAASKANPALPSTRRAQASIPSLPQQPPFVLEHRTATTTFGLPDSTTDDSTT